MHFPDAATSASNATSRASMAIAPKLLIASTMRLLPRVATAAAISGNGLRMPVEVSEWINPTCVMDASASRARATSPAVVGTSSAVSNVLSLRPIISVSLAIRLPYAPLISTSTWPSRGTIVLTAASTENVPLPCMGTQTCVASALTIAVRLSRTRAVTALKRLSHEPQSRSIADLVASEVISGPGVSRMGSRSKLLIGAWLPRSEVYIDGGSRRCRRLAPSLRRAEQPARRTRVDQAHRCRSRDDQRAHRRRRADLSRLVEVDDCDRGDLGVGRVQKHDGRDRHHGVDEEVARDVENRRQADRHRHAEESLVERHPERRRDRLELVVQRLERGDRGQMTRRVVVYDRRRRQDQHAPVEKVQRVVGMIEEEDVTQAQHHARNGHRNRRQEPNESAGHAHAARLFE